MALLHFARPVLTLDQQSGNILQQVLLTREIFEGNGWSGVRGNFAAIIKSPVGIEKIIDCRGGNNAQNLEVVIRRTNVSNTSINGIIYISRVLNEFVKACFVD